MLVLGLEYLQAIAEGVAFEGKMVINERGAVFGPVSTEHRELRAAGIAYADNYKGDAVAAMLAPGKIEMRFHERYTDEQVAGFVRALATEPGLALLATWEVTYQGRRLRIA